MSNFTSADVKRLRDLTGAGMMDCKKALSSTDGDFDKAIEELRIKGAAKAAKREAERTAANGLVAAREGAMVELNCETDFVAKNDQFQQLADQVVAAAAASRPGSVEELNTQQLEDGRTVGETVEALAAVIGEKLALGKVATLDGQTTIYLHRRATDLPPQVGVLVQYDGSDEEAARGAAMQVAAMRPRWLTRDEVPEELVESERRIALETAKEEGKPEQAFPKIVEGRVGGFYKDNVLLEQPSVQDQKQNVGQVLEAAGVTLRSFVHFEVGQA